MKTFYISIKWLIIIICIIFILCIISFAAGYFYADHQYIEVWRNITIEGHTYGFLDTIKR